MIRNHKLESKLAEEIVGYVLVNTDDYFAAEKELAQLSHNTGSPKLPLNCFACSKRFKVSNCKCSFGDSSCQTWQLRASA